MLSRQKLSGDPPETLRGGSAGGLRIFWLKSLANPEKIFKKKCFLHFLTILSGFASDLAKKTGDPPALCFEWGFTRTFPRNQDATVKLKSELISIKF